ncbi:MAG: polysaccharide deacetylase family protein [Opitutaceae bacterium]|nr:polysaccharide deacetylase family protein [Opitutaceae bacterium]
MKLRLTIAAALLLLGSLTAADTKPIRVAMIFDDGPHAEQTAKLLALFAEEKVHVTFGTVGKNAEKHPGLLQQVVAAGHEIANHSYSHLHPQKLDASAVDAEVLDGQQKITAAAGVAPVWYWPPFIAIDDQVRASVAKAGLKIYSPRKLVASGDYMNDVDAAELLRRATTGIVDGTVILFHEWRAETFAQMKAIIAELKRQGCVFVTYSEMEAQLGR